jgi:phosphate uptake regulator
MKRKVNRVGQNTLTVSLPSTWAREHGIKPGDEIEVAEDGSNLVMGSVVSPREMEISVDLTDAGVMLNRIAVAIYKAGFDKANITYNTPKELEIIQNAIYRSCHVFEIMNVRKNVIEIKAISELDPNDFNDVLRKMSHAIITIAKETYEAIKVLNYQELENLILKDQVVDRHTDFCRRIINKGYEIDYKLRAPLYSIAETTEIAADKFKIIGREVIKNKSKPGPEIMHLFAEINKLIEAFYNLLFDFSIEKVKDFGRMETKVRDEIDLLCRKERRDIKILAYLITTFEMVFEMKSALITMHAADLVTTKQ